MSGSPIQALFSRLKSVGIKPAFARRALPSWWDDSIASSEAGLQQAQIYFSKAFNLDIRSFDTPEIEFRQAQRKFKLSSNVTEESVRVSAHYATGIARVVLHSIDQQRQVPSKSLDLRSECLVEGTGVDLTALLQWCAKANIPVMHVDLLPGKKMTGLVVRNNDKFAIVLSKKGCQSEMLFWLAHELGHIAHSHLRQDGFFADEQIGSNVNDDEEERQADSYGVHLLNGSDTKYSIQNLIRAEELAAAAVRLGRIKNVDAGHILLNFGHHSNKFPLAKAALKVLGQASTLASKAVNKSFFDSISHDSFSEDQIDFLQTACSYNASSIPAN